MAEIGTVTVKVALELAEKITIDRRGLLFDSKRLPFYLADEPIIVEYEPGGVNRVTVVLLAAAVEIDPAMDVESEGDVFTVTSPRGEAVA